MQLTASTAASSGSEDADGEELVEPPEPEATEPPSRRAAIRRLDGRRFSGAQAWPAPVAPCAHPFARRPRCWWRVNTQSASPTPLTCVHGCGRGEVPDHAWAACRRRAVVVHSARRAACWQSFGGQNKRAHVRHHVSRGRIGGVLGARRGLGGDSPGPWPARWHARITQRPRDGELQPELYILAVNGQFHDLVKRTKNRLRASRARSGEAPGRAQPMGNAQRARRRLAGFARGTGSGRAMG